MIGSLRGKLLEKNPPSALIEVNGIGYELSMPMSSFYDLPETGREVFVYTSLVIREDAQLLFGFTGREAKFLFGELIKVSGIGPKTALAILSSFTPGEFAAAVQDNKIAALTRVPGIGRKTAERMIIEIRDRVKTWKIGAAPEGAAAGAETGAPEGIGLVIETDAETQAVQALVSLGYKTAQAASAVHRAYRDGMSVQDVIRLALKSV